MGKRLAPGGQRIRWCDPVVSDMHKVPKRPLRRRAAIPLERASNRGRPAYRRRQGAVTRRLVSSNKTAWPSLATCTRAQSLPEALYLAPVEARPLPVSVQSPAALGLPASQEEKILPHVVLGRSLGGSILCGSWPRKTAAEQKLKGGPSSRSHGLDNRGRKNAKSETSPHQRHVDLCASARHGSDRNP